MSNEANINEQKPTAEETKPVVEATDSELEEISGARPQAVYGVPDIP